VLLKQREIEEKAAEAEREKRRKVNEELLKEVAGKDKSDKADKKDKDKKKSAGDKKKKAAAEGTAD